MQQKPETEYVEMDERTSGLFSELVERKCGLSFPPKKFDDLKSGVLKAFHYSGCGNLLEFYQVLAGNGAEHPLFRSLVTYLTVNETYFFRHFGVLEKELLPLICQSRSASKTLRIWSAGCASGEEPYSIAMVLDSIIPDIGSWDVSVIATDINDNLRAFAAEGIYRPWSLRSCDGYYKKKYFRNVDGFYHLDERIKKMVSFDFLNLAKPPYWFRGNPMDEFDLILCRNVTIYFELHTTILIVNNFYDALKDKGYLIVGHAEPSVLIYNKFRSEVFPDAVVYQKDLAKEPVNSTGIRIRSAARVPKSSKPPKVSTAPKTNGSERKPLAVKKRAPATAGREFQEKRIDAKTETEVFGEALELFWAKKTDEAIQRFKEVIEVNPDNARAYYMIAHIHANLDQVEEAKDWSSKALKRNPLLIEAYYLLALIHTEEKKYDEAIRLLKKVIYIDIEFALGYYEIAMNYFKLGNTVLGHKNLNEARKIIDKKDPLEKIGILKELTAGELKTMTQIWD